jgi:hypothetical protein
MAASLRSARLLGLSVAVVNPSAETSSGQLHYV